MSIEFAKNFEHTTINGDSIMKTFHNLAEDKCQENKIAYANNLLIVNFNFLVIRICSSLEKLTETILFLARQNIPPRGHRDSGVIAETAENNEGNFRELLRWRAYICNDDVLRKHLENSGKNSTYISPVIQNEIINNCGQIIQVLTFNNKIYTFKI